MRAVDPGAKDRPPRPLEDGASPEGPAPAVIFGHSIASLGAMRSLGRKGIPVFTATIGDSFVSRSKWYVPCPGATDNYPEPWDLSDFLEGLPFVKAVLVACSDDWVRAVATLDEALRIRFPASLPDPVVLEGLLDKARLAAQLERLGLPHPKTVPLSSARDLEALPDELFANALLKPRDSLSFSRHYLQKAFFVHHKAEALARFAEIEGAGHTVVLQEFIPAAVSDHYLISGFIDRSGVLRGRVVRQRIRIFPPETGIGSCEVSRPLETVATAWQTLDELFSKIRYRGIFSAEFVRDPRDGLFRLLDVNARPFVHMEFAAQCGVDLALMSYRDALGEPIETVPGFGVGRRSLDLYADALASWSLLRRGDLSASSWLRSCLGALGLVFAWDDPMPGLRRFRDFFLDQVQVARQRGTPASGSPVSR